MKVVVSYINSLYGKKETIDELNKTSADGIHVDLMDGIYAGEKNFEISELENLFHNNLKPLDVHLMVEQPSKILNDIYKLSPVAIYIHPNTDNGIINILQDMNIHSVLPGIAINPDEKVIDFEMYFPYVKRVLLMSVVPGYGGQEFIIDTTKKLEELKMYKKQYDFEIFVDGGINAETIDLVTGGADGVVSGSYICMNEDFEKMIEDLK